MGLLLLFSAGDPDVHHDHVNLEQSTTTTLPLRDSAGSQALLSSSRSISALQHSKLIVSAWTTQHDNGLLSLWLAQGAGRQSALLFLTLFPVRGAMALQGQIGHLIHAISASRVATPPPGCQSAGILSPACS